MDGEAINKDEPAAIIAVIFGASEFPHAEALSSSPAFAGSASAFAAYLQSEQGFRLTESQVLNLFDNTSNVIDQNDQLVTHLLRNQDASDLIIYYVGHGGFLPDREYFLALHSTKRGAEGITGLRIRALAHSLEEHFPGKRVFLILDCCFAGEAVAQFQSDDIGTIVENKTFDALPSSGTSLLVAASKDEPAVAPTGAAYTMFSDCFLAALTQGRADGKQKLSLADIGELVQERVRSSFGQRGVRPEIHSPRQTGGDVAKMPLFPNPAYLPPKPRQLPAEIRQALHNPIADIRQGAIRPLAQYLNAGDAALAALARTELEHLAAQDDSRSVQQRAREALGVGQASAEITPAPKVIHHPPPQKKASPAAPTKPKARLGQWAILASIVLIMFIATVIWGFFYQGGGDKKVASPPETQVQQPPASSGGGASEEQPKTPKTRTSDQSERIRALLVNAERGLEDDRLDSPAGNNAVQDYRAVLALDPDNRAAQAGLERVFNRYLVLAERALGANALGDAAQFLTKAENMRPGNTTVSTLRQQIANARKAIEEREIIERLLSEAEINLRNDRLTSPEGNNAVQRYRAVLERDAGNAAARAGLARVVARYLVLADSAIAGKKFDKAKAYLTKAEAIGPDNPDLPKMRARLEKKRAGAGQSEKIQALLADAERHFQLSQQGVSKPGSAVTLYQAVLDLDPGNRAAVAGLGRVIDEYLEDAERALAGKKFDQAAAHLAKAEEIDANNSALLAMRARLEQARATPAQLTLAVFPFESLANCHYSVRDEVTDAADAIIGRQARASIEYSYYAEGADAGRIPSAGALWSDNAARREPLMDMVRKAGRDLGVNGVLMVWFECSQSQYVPTDRYKVDVYLIDVDGDRIFHATEGFLDARRAIAQVFKQFFAAYGFESG